MSEMEFLALALAAAVFIHALLRAIESDQKSLGVRDYERQPH